MHGVDAYAVRAHSSAAMRASWFSAAFEAE